MQAKTTNIIKRIVDVLLTVLLLFLMAYQVTGDVLHEWLGISDFKKMCNTLSGYTKVCVISFIDLYDKVTRNFPQVSTVTPQERIAIGKAFAETGSRYGITIKACAEGNATAV